MTTNMSPAPLSDDPRLVAFLPMVYVAWADGDLSSDEIGRICTEIRRSEELDCSCQEALGHWLDPERPPTAGQLRDLLTTIRRAASGLSTKERRSLTELGLALAQAGGQTLPAPEREALVKLESVLQLSGPEVARRILTPVRPEAEAPSRPTAPFEAALLEEILAGEDRDTRERVFTLLATPPFAWEDGVSTAAARQRTLARCRILAREGLGALSLPVEHGGSGDPGAFLAVFETLAHHDLSVLVKFGVQFGLFAGSIHQLGSSDQHARYLPDAATLRLPGCFAMTETGHGSNVADLETTARFDRQTEEFMIHTPSSAAMKDYIGNAADHGRLATVFAQLEIDGERHGVHALLVPIRDERGRPLPGVRIEDCGEKLGLNGVDNGRLGFDDVRVPRENLLGRFARVDPDGTYSSPIASPAKRFFTMLGTLVGGRVSVALAALSASKSALTIAVRHAERRRQFGPEGAPEVPLLDYRTHQRRLLSRLATTYALHFGLRALRRRYLERSEADSRELDGMAAGLKAFATWHATDTIQECREACGGHGYLAENRFAALKADTDVFTTFEGDNTVLMQLLAKALLTRYRRQFGEMGFFDLVRYVAERAGTTIAELNPVVTRNTDARHLRSAEFQDNAMRWREEHLLHTVSRRLKKRLDDGMDSFQALIEVQDHVVATAKAHVERLLLEQFDGALEQVTEKDLRTALTLQRDLFALSRIESDRGWFLEHGYLEPSKSKAIRKLVNRLCREARPAALALVDAFGIPDEVLGAPIAT